MRIKTLTRRHRAPQWRAKQKQILIPINYPLQHHVGKQSGSGWVSRACGTPAHGGCANGSGRSRPALRTYATPSSGRGWTCTKLDVPATTRIVVSSVWLREQCLSSLMVSVKLVAWQWRSMGYLLPLRHAQIRSPLRLEIPLRFDSVLSPSPGQRPAAEA